MMRDINLYQSYISNARTRDEFYLEALSNIDSDKETQITIRTLLEQREHQGSIQIEEGVLLPHIESEAITSNRIHVYSFENPIQDWNDTVKDIHLIIVVVLSTQASMSDRKEIVEFIRSLASKEVLESLYHF